MSATAESWQVIFASQAGDFHLRRGEACADAFAQGCCGPALILAVADGAGSATRGREGAAVASRQAVSSAVSLLASAPPEPASEARHRFVREVLRQTLAGSLDEIRQLIAEAGVAAAAGLERPWQPADFQSTLLLAILSGRSLMVGNIGDGWLVAQRHDGELRVVAPPQRGEYSNETFFLTSRGALDEAVIEAVPQRDLAAIALLSDGPAWFAIDLATGSPSGPLFDKLFAFARDPTLPAGEKERELAAFLASEPVSRKTADDMTLVLAARVSRPFPR